MELHEPKLKPVTTTDEIQQVQHFLEDHIETSVFLLSCLRRHGPALGAHPNSGSYRFVAERAAVVGVSSMTRRAHLLAQLGGRGDLVDVVAGGCTLDGIPMQGILAEWEAADGIAEALARRGAFRPAKRLKHVVFSRPARGRNAPDDGHGPADVRLLTDRDFEAWDVLNSAFLVELGSAVTVDLAARRAAFGRRTALEYWWGAFRDGRLVAIAAVDDAYAGVGQVGNLYTAPDHRREGIARHLLDVLQHDVRRLHDIERLVLFVEEDNDGARALYRAMDFTPAGAFGMIFSDTAPSLGFVQVPSRA